MRFLFHNPYRALERKLGYRFKRKKWLTAALMHRSFRFEREGIRMDNQRLEFLGDAALGLVAGEYLFDQFEEIQEGTLTCLRSRMTNGKALAAVGRAIELGEQLKLGKGEQKTGGHYRDSNIEDALEAILGAAYLDGGVKAVRKIFETVFVPFIDIQPDDVWSDNPKGRLQSLAQKYYRANPSYRIVAQHGPAHARVFTVDVGIKDQPLGSGQGPTRREAEQSAAAEAVSKVEQAHAHGRKAR